LNVAQHTRKHNAPDLVAESRKLYDVRVRVRAHGGIEDTYVGGVDGFALADYVETAMLARCRRLRLHEHANRKHGCVRILVQRLR
jgi:hypothetical protein